MTKITTDRAIVRETGSLERTRALCIELAPRGVTIWPKGLAESVFVPWDVIFDLGRKLAARELSQTNGRK
jgi:hypothetical protein